VLWDSKIGAEEGRPALSEAAEDDDNACAAARPTESSRDSALEKRWCTEAGNKSFTSLEGGKMGGNNGN
jgi:hypothetical protein